MIINKIPGKIQINRKDITNGLNYFMGDSGAAARRMYNNLMNFISTLASRHSQKMHYVIHITQNSSFFFFSFFSLHHFPPSQGDRNQKTQNFNPKKICVIIIKVCLFVFFQPNQKRERMFFRRREEQDGKTFLNLFFLL